MDFIKCKERTAFQELCSPKKKKKHSKYIFDFRVSHWSVIALKTFQRQRKFCDKKSAVGTALSSHPYTAAGSSPHNLHSLSA